MKINTIVSLPSTRLNVRTALLLIVVLLIVGMLTGCASAAVVDAQTATSQLISPVEYVTDFDDSASHLLIDVRTPDEFASGHIEGAVNIPVEEISGRLDEIPGDAPIVVYCRSGNRSAAAARILTDAGYAPVYDLGGIQDWVAEGLPIVNYFRFAPLGLPAGLHVGRPVICSTQNISSLDNQPNRSCRLVIFPDLCS